MLGRLLQALTVKKSVCSTLVAVAVGGEAVDGDPELLEGGGVPSQVTKPSSGVASAGGKEDRRGDKHSA